MIEYQVYVNPKIEKALSSLNKETARKVRDKIRALAKDPRPHGSLKLSGQENAYRVRVGDYRIIYEIYDSKILILVIHVGHRKDVYK